MSKVPTILRKDDSQQRNPRVQSRQPVPKILTKSKDKEIAPITAPIKKIQLEIAEKPVIAPTWMKKCQRLMHPHFQLDQKILEYLDSDNIDFLVVGIIGKSSVGKSTLMNLIATESSYLSCESNSVTFQQDNEVFPTSGVTYEGNSIDVFISKDRIIFLDTSPINSNFQRRDMIVSECDDIKMLSMMLQLCHLILVVNNGFPDASVSRLLKIADQITPNTVTHRPIITYIGNRVQPGTKIIQMDSRLHKGSNLLVPDFLHRDIHLHHDVLEVIQSLQEKVFMSKRWSMELDEEAFTEKKWGQRLINVIQDQMKNDYFLRKYEALRDKFHQPIEN